MAETTTRPATPIVRPDYKLSDSLWASSGSIFLTGTCPFLQPVLHRLAVQRLNRYLRQIVIVVGPIVLLQIHDGLSRLAILTG